MTITAKIGRRGQLTLPKEIRERLELVEGQRLAFVIRNGDVTLQPLPTTLLDHRGAVAVDGRQDFDEIRKAVQRARAGRRAEGG